MNEQYYSAQTLSSKKQEKLLLSLLYVVLCFSSSAALVPIGAASVFALMICICTLAAIYTYRVRARKSDNTLVRKHTTYMIKTFWRASLLMIVSCFLGLLYMLVVIDYQPLGSCTEAVFGAINKGHIRVLYKIMEICGDLFVEQNKTNLHIAGFIAFCPVFIYVLWRCAKGGMLLALSEAQSGEENAYLRK